MDAIDKLIAQSLTTPPNLVARYRAVLWEPLPGTGERVAALVSVEPTSGATDELLAGTYPVLKPERLRAIFGRRRGDAAAGVIRECAAFMTSRQLAGVPLEQVAPLFSGFILGPILQARAYGIEQLLDAAVRTVSSIGSADEILVETDSNRPGLTRRTADFLREVRRVFSDGDDLLQRRFHVRLQREQSAPEVWVDYAAGHRVVQAASVPGSAKQASPAELELKSKLLDLEVVRDEFSGNRFEPMVLLNVRSLEEPASEDALKLAKRAHEQFRRYADWAKFEMLEVSSPDAAAHALERL